MKVLLDTSVYIEILRSAEFASGFRGRYARDLPRTYLSSVVAQELLAGASTFAERRQVGQLIGPFEKVRRVVVPSHGDWKRAGSVVARLLSRVPQYQDKIRRGLLNDVLIISSARTIGAKVVTRNAADFRLVRGVLRFSLEII